MHELFPCRASRIGNSDGHPVLHVTFDPDPQSLRARRIKLVVNGFDARLDISIVQAHLGQNIVRRRKLVAKLRACHLGSVMRVCEMSNG
ncbi:hypothetical protein D3C80_1456810 [compost metagenome]